ncbi:hypothetical protein ACFL6X_00585 [Candidatus Latescibacterota bacterium]
MQEMVEPDRTIMIVSIIGLVVIWGSVAYHKFVQGGGPPRVVDPPSQISPDSGQAGEDATQGTSRGGKRRKKR